MSNRYTSENIQILKGLEGVRKRPSMYIGSTSDTGLHHLVYELVDNSVDEALAGYCTRITITLEKDGSVTTVDNGRGIPVEEHPEEKMSGLEVVMTKLHAGGKFNNKSYLFSAGLHGVGLSVVNALSSMCVVRVWRSGVVWEQSYCRGIVQSPLLNKGIADKTGTQINFLPDPDIFSTTVFNFEVLSRRLREISFLHPGITIEIIDSRGEKPVSQSFCFEGGIKDFVLYLNRSKSMLHREVIYGKEEIETSAIEFCLAYNTGINEQVFSFVNTVSTRDGGTHLSGFRSALLKSINEVFKSMKIQKKSITSFESDDVREGLSAVVTIKLRDPQFEGQTKTKLGNAEIRGQVDSMVRRHLMHYFETHPKETELIIKKILTAAEARLAAQKAKEVTRRKSIFDSTGLPGLLVDCAEKDPAKSEIYIVEGDSAGGSAKQGRDRHFQAILPLRGKLLNVEKNRIDKVLSNEKLQPIIMTLGAGIDDTFDIRKLRYHKVIMLADSDVDGSHIRTLMLTFFFRYMRPAIEAGYIYIAQPPLYKITSGKKSQYALSDKERDDYLATLDPKAKVSIQRYKGLGEMNPDQLWETTMDPKARTLLQVRLQDEVSADVLFSLLMGDEVAPRREFIQEHALQISELDV